MHKAGDPQDQAALRQNVRIRTIALLEAWERVSIDQQRPDDPNEVLPAGGR